MDIYGPDFAHDNTLASMDHLIWTDTGWMAAPCIPESYVPPSQELVECSDGKLRTAEERDAWLNAIWGAVRDGAVT